MLLRTAFTLAAILALSTEVALVSQPEQRPSPPPNLEAIKIEIKPGELRRHEQPKPLNCGTAGACEMVDP